MLYSDWTYFGNSCDCGELGKFGIFIFERYYSLGVSQASDTDDTTTHLSMFLYSWVDV